MTTRFVLDARHVQAEGQDGVTRVLLGLFAAVARALDEGERVILLARPRAASRVAGVVAVAGRQAAIAEVDVAVASARQLVRLQPVLEHLRPDAYFYPQYDLPLFSGGVGAVAYVHDVTPVVFPRYFGARPRPLRRAAASLLLAQTCARARLVLTPSSATATRLSGLFPWVRGRVRVAAPGPTALPSPEPRPPRRRARFVYVGNHRPHKQVDVLLRAFAELRRTVPEAELFLVGRTDPRFPEIPALLRGALGEGVVLEEDADDARVSQLLHSARALVFPSVGEGFGMPVLEAYAAGTPTIVADAMALPEVAAEGGLHVPAGTPGALARAMGRLVHDDARFEELQAAAAAVLQRYSFDRTAEVVLTALREVARTGTAV